MSSQKLQEIISQAEKLTDKEQLELISYLMEKLNQEGETFCPIEQEKVPDPMRKLEYQWLAKHRGQYSGQYVALDGNKLISYGKNGREVLTEARKLGVKHPYIVHIEEVNSLLVEG